MSENNLTSIATEHRYRHIFNTEFNLSFHHPKKDQCDECASFKFLTNEEKEIPKFKDKYNEHIRTKNLARLLMNTDKTAATNDLSILCATFDLQKVLSLPRSQISKMFYNRKLSIYNITIFDMVSKEGKCNVWNEAIAKRGANEICSCLWKFITEKVRTGIVEFRFFSDNCAAQNKNQILFSMYIKAASDYNVTITHRYEGLFNDS